MVRDKIPNSSNGVEFHNNSQQNLPPLIAVNRFGRGPHGIPHWIQQFSAREGVHPNGSGELVALSGHPPKTIYVADFLPGRRPERKEPDRTNIRLTTNSTIPVIGELIETADLDWDTHQEILLHSPFTTDINNIQGSFAELHVNEQLLQIAAAFGDVCKIPDLHDVKTDNFFFKRHKNGKLSVQRHTATVQEAEYDAIVEIDGLPTVFEIKTANPYDPRNEDAYSFTQEWYQRILHPLQEHYGRDDFGLVIVTVPEFFRVNSNYHQGLNQDGLHYYTLNTTRRRLNRQSHNLLKQRNALVGV